jgi:hypothetical protein
MRRFIKRFRGWTLSRLKHAKKKARWAVRNFVNGVRI